MMPEPTPAPENPATTDTRPLSERLTKYYGEASEHPFPAIFIELAHDVEAQDARLAGLESLMASTHEGIGIEKARVGALETRLAAIEERMRPCTTTTRGPGTHIPAAFDAPPPSPQRNVISRTKEDLAHELESANRRIEQLEDYQRKHNKKLGAIFDALVSYLPIGRQNLTLAEAITELGESNSAKAAKIKELEKDNRSHAQASLRLNEELMRCQKMLTEQGEPNESSESSWLPLEERLASFIKRTSEEIALLKKANQAIDGAREKAEKEADALRQQLRQVRIAAGEEPKAS